MIRQVLIVDDNPELLLSLQDGLEKYTETFRVMMAGDGAAAIELLKKNPISLMVTDLKMPKMDGFALLSHVMEHYPDIPVIIITAYGTAKIEAYARNGGAVAYLEKPFMIEKLAQKIMTVLRNESDGGTLHGVSSGTFLQLIEMEEKTCTIRIKNNKDGQLGALFFRSGRLMEARADGLRGIAAAHKIFSWSNTRISIQNSCTVNDQRIENNNIQSLLLESMRQKDETRQEQSAKKPEKGLEPPVQPRRKVKSNPADGENSLDTLRRRIHRDLGPSLGPVSIYTDSTWDNFISLCESIGKGLNAGRLKVGYIDQGHSEDTVILPGTPATVLSVNTKCPRDQVVDFLSR